jgi:hypothetical protein
MPSVSTGSFCGKARGAGYQENGGVSEVKVFARYQFRHLAVCNKDISLADIVYLLTLEKKL